MPALSINFELLLIVLQTISDEMLPARTPSQEWICGGMRGIKHEALVARGGYGEVHRVRVSYIHR